jgi:hypothetical protein
MLVIAGVALAPAGCGKPPQPQPTAPVYASPSAGGLAGAAIPPGAVPPGGALVTTPPTGAGLAPTGLAPTGLVPTGLVPTGLVPTPVFPGANQGYPTRAATTTAAGTTVSPTPTPSHAAKCAGSPTGAEILALIKGKAGIPSKTLKVDDGPFCADNWSFTTAEVAGKDADEQDPLMVVAYGSGATLQFVAAGSDVCNTPVQTGAPAGIRVLACGF